jgi:5'-3' exoribonuclease 2
MSVLPRQSAHALPSCLRDLLASPNSEIIDFYPIDFKLDVNGFKFAWMGVNLLPFVDKDRLLAAVASKEDQFTDEDKNRNANGVPLLIIDDREYNKIKEPILENPTAEVELNNADELNISGNVSACESEPKLGGLHTPP